MFRVFRAATRSTVSRWTAAGMTAARPYVTDVPEAGEQVAAIPMEKMWGLWNEGNLFSLSQAQLTAFLVAQNAEIDKQWKKAALVRAVEEMLAANEQKAKQAATKQASMESGQGGDYGSWDKDASTKGDMLLDLNQAGFYQGDAQAAPRAFQLIVDNSATDLVVARVNTTSFPGAAASAECYTLVSADAQQSARARFMKTLKWCAINLRTLQLDGQMRVDLGKLVLKPEVVRKGARVVSAWTLQQRLQATAPYHWVSCAADDAAPAIESYLSEAGFDGPSKPKVSFDVTVRRAKDSLLVTLNSKGAATAVNRTWEKLQSTHFTTPAGQDIRFMFRARKPVSQQDNDLFTKVPIVDVTSDDTVGIQLPPEHGEVLYCSENESRTWSKALSGGGKVTVTETKRQPLVIARDEEDGERLEYALEVDVPRDASDIGEIALELHAMAKKMADVSNDAFNAQFQTVAKSPDLAAE